MVKVEKVCEWHAPGISGASVSD